MPSPIQTAIKQICEEKGITEESVLETIEHALAAAYRKDFAEKTQNIKVKFDLETTGIRVFDVKTVMDPPPEEELEEGDPSAGSGPDGKEEKKELAEGEEEEIRFNPKFHVSLADAQDIKPDAQFDDEIRVELEVPGEFGRMAAQTAKQVIIQKIREAERNTIYDEFKDHEGEVMVATVQRREGPSLLLDVGRATAIMPPEEQVPRERYNSGDRVKVYVVSVEQTARGPEIIVSRTHEEIVRQLFAMEIPEISAGTVDIKGLAREPGGRSKVAVYTDMDNIDPIGSCVGQRGARIQSIISELGGEKVDIVLYDEDPSQYIINALSPAKISSITLGEDGETAIAHVKEDQLSLAIGKSGQNIRLAGKLTGYKIDIQSEDGEVINPEEDSEQPEESEELKEEEEKEEEAKEEKDPSAGSGPDGKKESTSASPDDEASEDKK